VNFVTMGGVTIGLCILAAHLYRWYPGHRVLKKDPLKHAGDLFPFVLSWAYGCLTVLGIGGIIGYMARTARWISNWLGDAALVWGVGGEWQQGASAPTYIPLTQAGGGLVLIMTVLIVVAIKKSSVGGEIRNGVWCGICLGTSAGVAGFAAVPLATAANWLGEALYGVFE
jgi:hypothetical protein